MDSDLPLCSGAFSRVCLVEPSHSAESDGSKLYALKMLRKTKGKVAEGLPGQNFMLSTLQ